MQRAKIFFKKHLFLILLSFAGVIITGFFGLITGAIAGAVLDQLFFRIKNKDAKEEGGQNEKQNPSASKKIAPTEEDFIILGIKPGTSQAEIKKIYHKLAAQFHPDRTIDLSPEQRESSEEAFKKIQSAYERVVGK